jgi:hypothetical protein
VGGNNIKIDVKEIRYQDVNWIDFVQNKARLLKHENEPCVL